MIPDLYSHLPGHGYAVVALLVMLESMGVPAPGETALVTASAYAGATDQMSIGGVLVAAMLGAATGGHVGFWLGHGAGYRALLRYGGYIGMTDDRIELTKRLFLRRAGMLVLSGRFVPLFRAVAPLLAGVNRMTWTRFFLFNLAGSTAWASLLGGGAYLLGDRAHGLIGPVAAVEVAIAAIGLVTFYVLLRQEKAQSHQGADRTSPGC